MTMTPTKTVVNDIISLGVLTENYFDDTRPTLVATLTSWENTYKEYLDTIALYQDYFADLDGNEYIWSLVPADIDVLRAAWVKINELINYFADYLSEIPESKFTCKELTNAGIEYVNIYGTGGDLSSDATVTTGYYTIIPSSSKLVTFAVREVGYAPDTEYAGKYLYQLNVNSDNNLTNDDYQSAQISPKWEMPPCHMIPFYDAYDASIEHYYRLDEDVVDFVDAEVTNQETLNIARETYGMVFTLDTTKWMLIVNFGEREEYIVTDKDMSYAEMKYTLAETYTGVGYYYYLVTATTWGSVYIRSQEAFEAAKAEHGSLYTQSFAGHYVFEDVHILNAYDIIIRELSPEVDPFSVKCLSCGHQGVMQVSTRPDSLRPTFRCPECENMDMEAMEIPVVYFQGKNHPLFTYDPDFNWYEAYIESLTLSKQLICKKLWKGRFGTGNKYTINDLDDLPTIDTISSKGWDKKASTLAKDFLKLTAEFDLQTLSTTLDGMKVKTQFKKLYQLANVFAIRHEIIRLYYSLLTRLLREGAKVEI